MSILLAILAILFGGLIFVTACYTEKYKGILAVIQLIVTFILSLKGFSLPIAFGIAGIPNAIILAFFGNIFSPKQSAQMDAEMEQAKAEYLEEMKRKHGVGLGITREQQIEYAILNHIKH